MPDENLDIAAAIADAPVGDKPATGTVIEPGETGTVEVDPAKKPDGVEVQPPKPGEKPAPVEVKKPDATAPDVSKTVADQGAAIQELLRRAVEQPAGKPAAAGPDKPFYDIKVPEVIVNAMGSEDPAERGQAVNALITGSMNALRRDILEHITREVLPSIPKMISEQTSAAEVQKKVYEDFYGTFKTLDKPQLRPLVLEIAKREAAAMGATYPGWTPEFRDRVGNATLALIAEVTGQPPAKQNGKKQPPFVAGGGTRVSGTKANEFLDSIGLAPTPN